MPRPPVVVKDGFIISKGREPLAVRLCLKCNEPIKYRNRGTRYVVSKYCSKQCCGSFNGGENHKNWKGGHTISGEGYRKISIYNFPSEVHDILWPMIRTGRFDLLEHRAVMAISVGRPLHLRETVHHKNGNRTDNRLENLELRVGPHGAGATADCLVCPHCNKRYSDPTN